MALLECTCYSPIHLGTKLSFPQCVIKAEIYDSVNLLKQRSVAMEKDCNSCAQNSLLISLSGYTEGKKPYFLFHIIKVSLLYLSLSQENQPTATVSRHHTASVYERPQAPSRGQVAEPHGWGAKPWSSPLCNLHGWNHHPLVQIHLRVPLQCRLIDSACVGGFGAVYTECQASARQLSVRLQSEWVMWEDGRGWKWVEGTAASGIREPRPACGIWLCQRRAAAAPQALTDTQLL